ncbi:DUF4168 domain-containing protein [Oscillatoria sp. FACHB-1407]|uniref:DUF4168 domain-containing protein n=1 Tax=Oscillatoria sp. FACHB-1407 TaxID=2692847 RepID=UPI001686FBDA|nr:DUF4168 domain-containing protein [Oscillatoria sp. FACHB-1407]MBD2461632.1 DUF4168 domain-containing protein [Oscillatoria sp. FACHB-1407]
MFRKAFRRSLAQPFSFNRLARHNPAQFLVPDSRIGRVFQAIQKAVLLTFSFLLCLLLYLCLWVSGAIAQELPPAPASPPATEFPDSPPNVDINAISSEKISQFVQAYLQVVELIERREGELQGAETDLESVRVQQEIEAEAFAIIESAGLTWQEYLQLLGLANTDPEFGDRIATQLQEAIR